MKHHETFADAVVDALTVGKYEPVASTRDRSVREMRLGPHHIRHRFGWPGGITAHEMLRRNVSKKNPLLQMLMSQNRRWD